MAAPPHSDCEAHLLTAQVDAAIPAILDRDIPSDPQVRVGGILASVNRRVKNGMPWASAQLEDLTGGIQAMFFRACLLHVRRRHRR
jgi:DNA polymerase-3 subunit alpha